MTGDGVVFLTKDPELCVRCKGVLGCEGKFEFLAGHPRPCPFDVLADPEKHGKKYEPEVREELRLMLEKELLS